MKTNYKNFNNQPKLWCCVTSASATPQDLWNWYGARYKSIIIVKKLRILVKPPNF